MVQQHQDHNSTGSELSCTAAGLHCPLLVNGVKGRGEKKTHYKQKCQISLFFCLFVFFSFICWVFYPEKRKYMTLDMKFGNWEKYITENKILSSCMVKKGNFYS